jgi:hypothetical protein
MPANAEFRPLNPSPPGKRHPSSITNGARRVDVPHDGDVVLTVRERTAATGLSHMPNAFDKRRENTLPLAVQILAVESEIVGEFDDFGQRG